MERPSILRTTYGHVLLALLGVAGIAALTTYATYNMASQQSVVDASATTINVSGQGKIQAVPDIGQFSFSVTAEATSAAEAQQKSATDINAIMTYLKGAGVAEKDIKTENYNLSPKYTYQQGMCPVGTYCPPGKRVLDGYTVSQTVVVKVRKLDQSGTLIAGVGQHGATDISSLSFTIDDPTALEAQARAKAIDNAKQKATALAHDLGMQLGKMTDFNENNNTPSPIMYSAAKSSEVAGMGGAAPDVPVGQNEITSNVTLTYEIH